MTNELKNVPELRFSEFDGVWENSKLGTVANVYDGTHQTPKYTIEGIKFLSVENIKTLNSNKFISKEAFEKEFKIRPEFGDVLMTRIGDVGTPNVIETNEDLAYYVSLALLKPKKLNSYFLESLIRSQTVQNELWRKTLHIAFPKKINKNEIAKVEINYPEQMEQQKIGEFFSKLDRQIELEEQKLAKLEEQKKGYMQKIFSQELRFKDGNGNDYPNWIFKELNNIFTKYQNTIYLHDNEEYKRISISNKGKITHRDITFGKRIGRKRQYLIDLKKHPNTLTFIRQGVFLGGIGFIPSSLDGYIVTENMPLLSMSEEYSKKFMTYLFSSESYYKSVIFKNLPTGSAQKALHEKDWLKSFVNIPVYSEQEKIGNFFEKQDNLIKKQSDKVELLKERKKGFLQKMFV
ncbi:restriction endonuclease subunit S [Staphylococcus succinus]|uniref:restriction endonuclease subunit S n=1 Tax=Staphylococcus succinus TaxID=61015 RepID=UPI002DBF2F68|nr:restriction endonuclease subunit S [Staphylococcus succinus]MEB8123843.1 restriction endonuclease subunit S [Staphylococcus succinus]